MKEPDPPLSIRKAQLSDIDAITEIYNEAILATTATFDTVPKSASERLEWLKVHGDRHPVIVAELNGMVVGWASLSRWSERKAYDDTAETSFYVKSEYRGRGVGRKLAGSNHWRGASNEVPHTDRQDCRRRRCNIDLSESFGFVHVGTLKEVGRKFGRLLDVHILQKML